MCPIKFEIFKIQNLILDLRISSVYGHGARVITNASKKKIELIHNGHKMGLSSEKVHVHNKWFYMFTAYMYTEELSLCSNTITNYPV